LATTLEKNKSPRIKSRWPITIITNRCLIEGESISITTNGIFAHCKEQLHENETYRMVITLPQNRYVAVKGRVIWSNLNGVDPNGNFSDMGFSFVELPEEDRFLLNQAVSAQLA
jgi:hypothetical protein